MGLRAARAVLAALLAAAAAASKFVYDMPLERPYVTYEKTHGMFAPSDAPHRSPGDGASHIKVHVEFDLQGVDEAVCTQHFTDLVHVGVFDAYTWANQVGDRPGEPDAELCCTPALYERGVCESPGGLAVPFEVANRDVHEAHLCDWESGAGNATLADDVAVISFSRHIEASSLYTLVVASCNADVWVYGSSEWLNPYGHLPGEEFGYLDYYAVLLAMYAVLAAGWLALCVRHHADLLTLQVWISGVVLMALIEVTMFFVYYDTWNRTGVEPDALWAVATVLRVAKRTLSRQLVLIVALGYGVLRPVLGPEGPRIALLGAAYFFFSLLLALNPDSVFAMLPANATEAVFIVWILQSMVHTCAQLQARKQFARLTVYSRFNRVLVAFVVLSVIWAIYTVVVVQTDLYISRWHSRWMLAAMWEVLYFLVLGAICFLWAPSKHNKRYAFSMELSSIDDSESEFGLDEGDVDAATAAGAAADVEAANNSSLERLNALLNEDKPIEQKTD